MRSYFVTDAKLDPFDDVQAVLLSQNEASQANKPQEANKVNLAQVFPKQQQTKFYEYQQKLQTQ